MPGYGRGQGSHLQHMPGRHLLQHPWGALPRLLSGYALPGRVDRGEGIPDRMRGGAALPGRLDGNRVPCGELLPRRSNNAHPLPCVF
jgi:hypothetical protein